MRKFKEIVESNTEPEVGNLWLKDGRLKFFGPKGWSLINGAFDATPLYNAVNSSKGTVTNGFKTSLILALNEGRITYMYEKDSRGYLFKVLIGFATLDPRGNNLFLDVNNYDGRFRFNLDLTTNKVSLETSQNPATISEGAVNEMVAFSLNDTELDKKLNLQLAADFLFNKIEAVLVIGSRNGINYNTIGVYHDGYITALQKNHYIVFNVSFQDGSITIETDTKIDGLLPYVELKVGDDEETMQYNKEKLPNGEFFMHLEYGYGVGTFQSDSGGFAHITNAYGNELFYTINIDGAIMPDRDYVKPNEPYTLTLEANRINQQLTDIEASALKKAGELVIITSSGPVTYTRTEDSTSKMVYFTDSRKDGKTVLLTYNDTNKFLGFSEVPMARATENSVGGIIKGTAISNANSSDAVDKLNQLLVELRKSGVISE